MLKETLEELTEIVKYEIQGSNRKRAIRLLKKLDTDIKEVKLEVLEKACRKAYIEAGSLGEDAVLSVIFEVKGNTQ